MKRYILFFRTPKHVGQVLPEDTIIKIKEFYNDFKIKRTFNYYNLNQICNWDKIPIFWNMIPNKTIHFKGKKQLLLKLLIKKR